MWVERDGVAANLDGAECVEFLSYIPRLLIRHGGRTTLAIDGELAARTWAAICEKAMRDKIGPEFRDE